MESKYQQMYPHLFTPITIRNKQLKSRLVASPHGGGPNLYRAGDGGYSNFTETAAQYYANIARGGAAIVTTGHLGVDPRYYLGTNQELFNFFSDSQIHEHALPVMHMMTDLIHAYGSLASFELNHGGPHCTPVNGDKLLGVVDMVMPNGLEVQRIGYDEMERIADYFAKAAFIGKRGGFDIIDIHAAHSWLIGSFFSPLDNTRDDEFGGNWENRARFPMMVLERVRDAVGKDTIIEMRFSVSETIPGGISLEDAANTIALLSKYVDIVQCSVGRVHDQDLLASGFLMSSPYLDRGCNAGWAKEIKNRVGDKIIVETIGGINEPAMAESFLEEGCADLVAMARSFVADPNWGEKARSGHPEDIRPCIRCMRCLSYSNPPQHGTSVCSVNPRRIMPHPLAPSEYIVNRGKKRTAVIGGGPAGMAAALELAGRGHAVTLYEKSEKLGGLLFFADYVEFKGDIKRYCEYLVRQVEKNENIQVVLHTEATPDFVAQQKFDAVVVAIGADRFIPPVPGADGKNVMYSVDLFGREEQLGEKLVIIGGGFVGCELCVHLQSHGKQIDVVEMSDELMADSKDLEEERFFTIYHMTHELNMHRHSFEEVKEIDRVNVHLSTRCVEITEKGVYIEKDGQRTLIEADTVIMATGFRPNQAAVDAYRGVAYDVISVGNCRRAGDLSCTTADAYSAALRISG